MPALKSIKNGTWVLNYYILRCTALLFHPTQSQIACSNEENNQTIDATPEEIQ